MIWGVARIGGRGRILLWIWAAVVASIWLLIARGGRIVRLALVLLLLLLIALSGLRALILSILRRGLVRLVGRAKIRRLRWRDEQRTRNVFLVRRLRLQWLRRPVRKAYSAPGLRILIIVCQRRYILALPCSRRLAARIRSMLCSRVREWPHVFRTHYILAFV